MKYKSIKTDRDGYSFASKAEAALYDWLKLKVKNGDISNLKCQVQVSLTEAKIIYKPDFRFEQNGKLVFAEMKGFETPAWRIKRRLWTVYGPGNLQIYKMGYAGVYLVEELRP